MDKKMTGIYITVAGALLLLLSLFFSVMGLFNLYVAHDIWKFFTATVVAMILGVMSAFMLTGGLRRILLNE